MAWKSPRRQHGEGGVIKASSSQSQPLFSSPAETQVREIASKIGLFEGSEILAAVCQHMREQYVVEAWQLPDLDSRQWEKMNAPIGLAVAVKHISTHRLREQEIQRQFQEGYFKKNGKTMHEEEKEEDIEQTTCCDRNIFPSPSLPGWSSKKKERTNESEIEAKTISDEGTLGSKVDQNVMEVEANKASINISAITYDTKIKDEEAVTEKVASVSEDEPFQERNSQPLQSDNAETKNGFIEECADWLKLVMVATAKEDEETLSRVLKIDVENDDDHTGVIDSNVKPLPSTTTGEIEQANVEPVKETDPKTTRSLESKAFATPVKTKTADSLELDDLAPSTFVEKREDKLKSGIELSNIAKREISMAIEKDAEPTQVKAEPVDGMEQESSTQPAKVESEQQESQVEIRSTKRTEDGCLVVIQCEERSLVENDSEDGKDSVNKSINIEKYLEEEIGAREKEETPEAISSDSESDVNSNIFSGIPNNASFSEDEDDHIPGDKESADESTEFNPISSMSDLKATRSLLPENYADDITVSHSNVSPEGKKSASIRKNKAQKFPHEYDRGKYLTYMNKRDTFDLYQTLEMQQEFGI